MTDVYRAIIITDAIRAEAKALVSALSGRAAGMWDAGVAAPGASAPTHWISAGMVDPGLAMALASPAALKAVCDYKGFEITLATCERLLAATQVSDGTFTDEDGLVHEEDAHGFMARLGYGLWIEADNVPPQP